MIQFIRLIWYVNMLVVIFFILKQEPKLKGINNLSKREKGFSISSAREKALLQQTWVLFLFFVSLTIVIVKYSH
uniref:preprotein translocase subunit G n=1 Tax=Rhodospora sordida TaxID=362230 RepID=UPI001FCCCE59|nr:preprotein translocase subunit G [Rhodospora sordida]UNJ15026.1 preprotein translocase subunit G [Rhodospora sordida]